LWAAIPARSRGFDVFHLVFRKSSHSAERQCIEVADGGMVVVVRDSKNAAGPLLVFSRREWATFVRRL
jgi:hypothetical protein